MLVRLFAHEIHLLIRLDCNWQVDRLWDYKGGFDERRLNQRRLVDR